MTLPENVITLTRMSAAVAKAFGGAHACQHCAGKPQWMLVYDRIPPSIRPARRSRGPVRSFDLLCETHGAEAREALQARRSAPR